MHDPAESAGDGKLDLVPMIDCIMLLLLFFIMTTKFTADEKQISALLPTDQGTAITKQKNPVIEPPKDINLVVTPAGFPRGLTESAYQRSWEEVTRLRGHTPPSAELRVGGSDSIVLDGTLFTSQDKQAIQAQIEAIHDFVGRELAQREEAGDRTKQPPVNIQCFSGLSWGYALAVYDAVRAYEARHSPTTSSPSTTSNSSTMDAAQRSITFAPPRLRNHTAKELGQELWELKNLR
jgi:Biopolymer transport protein ExbD/TolR